MCGICYGDYDENTTFLNCNDCLFLEKLPENLGNFEGLDCSNCPFLEKLPENLEKLKYLNCYDCSRLQKLPDNLQNLEYLNCRDCPILQELASPKFPESLGKLEYLNCHNCRLLLNIPVGTISLVYCDGCPWLNHPNNPNYSSNIQNLLFLQKFVRKCQRYRRFVKYTNSRDFIEWIYSPERIGGRLSKQSIYRSLIHHLA
jgi:hypothetical protein